MSSGRAEARLLPAAGEAPGDRGGRTPAAPQQGALRAAPPPLCAAAAGWAGSAPPRAAAPELRGRRRARRRRRHGEGAVQGDGRGQENVSVLRRPAPRSGARRCGGVGPGAVAARGRNPRARCNRCEGSRGGA